MAFRSNAGCKAWDGSPGPSVPVIRDVATIRPRVVSGARIVHPTNGQASSAFSWRRLSTLLVKMRWTLTRLVVVRFALREIREDRILL